MIRLSGVIAAMLLAACRNLEDPASSQQTHLAVHGILDMWAGDATILVYRARTGLPRAVQMNGIGDDEPVADAQVSITGPDGVTRDAGRLGDPSGQCCLPGMYVFWPSLGGFTLTPGGTYALRIRTPAGEEVTGTTVMPGPVEFALQPPHTFFRLRDTLRMTWPRIPGAASYEVMIRLSHSGNEYRVFADTAYTLAGTALTIAGDEIFPRGEDTDVVVSAVEVNYYDYYRSQSDPFAGAAPSHLTGAVGVFGAIVPIFATRLLVR